MALVKLLDEEGERLSGLKVSIYYEKKKAPFRLFKVINLGRELRLENLTGLQAKVLLALLWAPTGLGTKEIAALVGCTTSAACRALASLCAQGLVSKVSRGLYEVNSSLAHFGKWLSPSRRHPQSQREKQ
jgi:hypothetical protein